MISSYATNSDIGQYKLCLSSHGQVSDYFTEGSLICSSLTGPTRKSAGTLSADIPNEVYLEIFKHLRPDVWINVETRQVLCNLALVCRFFASVVLPWIFENLTTTEKDPYTQLSWSRSAKFCRNILYGNPRAVLLAKYVKRWAFEGSSNQSRWTPAFFSLYFETLPFMPNLFKLDLDNIVMTKDLFQCLPNIPQLEALQLVRCAFDDSVQDKHLKKFTSVRLKKLTLHHHLSYNDLHRLLPYVDMSSLLYMELRSSTGLETLTTTGLPLEYLKISSITNSLELMEFLKSTPFLKVLCLKRLETPNVWPTSIIEPNYIPLLVELEACWSFCKFVVPGRPISCLRLTSPVSMMAAEESMVFKRSTCPITHLRIPASFYLSVPLSDCFPDLKRLEIEIEFGRCSDLIWDVCSGLTWDEVCFFAIDFSNSMTQVKPLQIVVWLAPPRHLKLQSFHVELPNSEFDPSSEMVSIWQKVLSALTSSFPSLVTAEFHLQNAFCKGILVDGSWTNRVDFFD